MILRISEDTSLINFVSTLLNRAIPHGKVAIDQL
jgi:hypothetical protein